MSWLAKSIANSLRLDDDDEEDMPIPFQVQTNSQSLSPASTPTARGVREDLSELTKTISGKFWGVASFLAAHSDPSHPQTQISDPELSDQLSEHTDLKASDEEAVIAGIRSDFAEIGGKLKSGISQLSSNKTVSEITKLASNLLQFESEEEKSLEEYGLDGVVGVTEDVVAFARDVAMHPETWLDFPLSDDVDSDDFELSDAQQEHALAIERVAPRLAALRMELCPGYMSDGCFWKIYFILVLPRLNKTDAELLSTPEIVEARAALTKELDKSKAKQEPESSDRGNADSEEQEQLLSLPSGSQLESWPLQTSAVEAVPSLVVPGDKMEKHHVQGTEVQMIEKSIVEEAPVNLASKEKHEDEIDEDDPDDWLKEDNSEMVGPSAASKATTNDDDVSFSDLEDDDSYVPASQEKAAPGLDSLTKDAPGWVQLSTSSPDSGKDDADRYAGSENPVGHNSETKDSSDWLDVDDVDVI